MNKDIIALAKKLRKNSTPAENLLWSNLRAEQLEGLKFRRQQLIGNYIVDFVCFENKIVIEVDGGQHSIEKEKDNIRDEWLKGQGFKVLRFWNNEVLMNIESVLEVIRMNCLSPSPDPSHQGRGNRRGYSIKGGGNERGFTLIELIMVIVLISIIASVAAMIILEGAKSYQKEVSYSDIHNQGRLAIERMAREIRMLRQTTEIGSTNTGTCPAFGSIANPANCLIFTDISETTITYSLSGTTLNRTVSGTPSPLANNVTTLEFRHYDNAGNPTTVAANVWLIEIYLIVSNAGESLPLRLRVHPRNF